MMPHCKTTGLVLDEKPFVGGSTPADAFVDRSRWGNVPYEYQYITWAQEVSGLWTRGFNGSNSSIRFTNSEKLNLRANFTIEYWFKSTDITSDQRNIIDKGFDKFITLGHQSSKLYFGYPSAANNVAGTTTMTGSGIWRYAVFAFDGTNINLYLNGGIDKTQAITMPTDQTQGWNIGYNTFGGRYTGAIWGVRFLSHALSAHEIRKHFSAERAWFGV